MEPVPSVLIYSIGAALIWGTGDFSGGVATKRFPVNQVLIYSQLIGVVLLGLFAVFIGEQIPTTSELLFGGLAGIFGGIGLMSLYKGLALGKMSTTAPIAAIVGTVIPVIFGSLIEGLPDILTGIGILSAMIAVYFLSSEDSEDEGTTPIKYPIIAGLGFAGFYIMVDLFSSTSIYWPLVASRVTMIALIFVLSLLPTNFHLTVDSKLRTPKYLLVLIAAGICDSAGNILFAFATRTGRLDIASSVSSLYPGTTVFLAYLFYRQKLTSFQWIGIAFAISAIFMIFMA
ncbi:MAG: EamA family transporter [Candidatus Kariarchaeaceae archaeon]|jgi:drug/metabolite transporter (DMT)-like permease